MRAFRTQFEASVNCHFFGLDIATVAAIAGTVVSVATAGISLISSQSAAAQSAANAQSVANYNSQIQQQNANLALQMSQYQAQQNAAVATQQNALIISQQQQDRLHAEATMAEAAINAGQSRQQAAFARQEADFARQQADAQQKRYEAGLENAKQLDLYAEQQQAQQREETRRIREESETRQSQLRAKYGSSGVTFEGSPLVVLADAARLAETLVQDSAFVSELEARKQQRAAAIGRFESGFHLIDKHGFLTQAAGYEGQAAAYENQAAGFDFQASPFDLAQIDYEGLIQKSRFETELAAASYDTLIAGERHKIAMNEADLTRFGGAVEASGIRSAGQASLISGIGNIGGSVLSGASTVARMPPRMQVRRATAIGSIR